MKKLITQGDWVLLKKPASEKKNINGFIVDHRSNNEGEVLAAPDCDLKPGDKVLFSESLIVGDYLAVKLENIIAKI